MVYEHFRDPSMNAQEFNYNAVAPARLLRLARADPRF